MTCKPLERECHPKRQETHRDPDARRCRVLDNHLAIPSGPHCRLLDLQPGRMSHAFKETIETKVLPTFLITWSELMVFLEALSLSLIAIIPSTTSRMVTWRQDIKRRDGWRVKLLSRRTVGQDSSVELVKQKRKTGDMIPWGLIRCQMEVQSSA